MGALAFRVTVTDGKGSASAVVQVNVLADRRKAVFVSKAGTADGDGSRARPLASIQRAIELAAPMGVGAGVYVAEGTYGESLSLATYVRIYGGFDAGWARDPGAHPTRIAGGAVAVTGNGVHDVLLDGIAVARAAVTAAGTSSYGVLLVNSQNVSVDGCAITSSAGKSVLSTPSREALLGAVARFVAPADGERTGP